MARHPPLQGDAGRANARFGLGMPPVPGEAERQATAEQEKAQGEKEAAAPKAEGWLLRMPESPRLFALKP